MTKRADVYRSKAVMMLVQAGILDLDDPDVTVYRSAAGDYEEKLYEIEGYWTGSDYSGDDVTESNQRSLVRDYPQLLLDQTKFYGHYGYGIQIDLDSWNDPENRETAIQLAEILIGLVVDYPLYDEEDNSRLIYERAEQAWDSWVRSDLESEIERLTGLDVDLTHEVPSKQFSMESVFWDLCRDHDIWPEAEGHRDVILSGINDDDFLIDLAREAVQAGAIDTRWLYDLTDTGYAILGEWMAEQFTITQDSIPGI